MIDDRPSGDRRIQEVIATGFEWWDGRRAREVIATYGEGQSRREIELAVNDRYVPYYASIRGDIDQ